MFLLPDFFVVDLSAPSMNGRMEKLVDGLELELEMIIDSRRRRGGFIVCDLALLCIVDCFNEMKV